MNKKNTSTVTDESNRRSRIVEVSAIFSIVAGFGVIVGWLADINALKSIFPNYTPMSVNTALCFCLVGAVMLLLHPKYEKKYARRGSLWLLAIVLTIGLLTLAEHVLRLDFGIDQVLLTQRDPSGSLLPGRMALNTAICFILISGSLLLFIIKGEKYLFISKVMNLLVLVIVSVAIFGYITNDSFYYVDMDFIPLALPTSFTFIIVGMGIHYLLPNKYRRRTKVEKQIITWFVVATLIIITIGVISVKSTQKLQEASNQVNHTQVVMLKTEEIVTSLKEMEAAVRGYALTGDTAYLEVFGNANSSLPLALQDIRKLTSGNPEQSGYILTLSNLVAGKTRIDSNTIELRKGKGLQAVASRAAIGAGDKAMKEIKSVIARMKDADARLLNERTRKESDQAKSTRTVILLFIFIRVGLVFAIYSLIARDITGRRRAEENLKTLNEELEQKVKDRTAELTVSEQRFRKIFESAPIGIALIDLDQRYIRVNKMLVDGFGYSEEEFLATSFHSITHPDDIGRNEQNIRKLLKNEIPYYAMNKRYIGKEGNIIWATLTGTLLRDSDGTPLYYLSMVENITERHYIEEELHRSHQILQFVFDNIPVGVFWKDRELRYLGCNREISRNFGLAGTEEIIGKTDGDLPWNSLSERYRLEELQVMETEIPMLHHEEKIVFPDGHYQWVRTSKIPLKEKNGSVLGILGTYEDITARKENEEKAWKLNEELKDLNASKDKFYSIIAHDLRNPFAVLLGLSEILIEDVDTLTTAEIKDFSIELNSSLKGQYQLLTDLLEWSRLQSRNFTLALETFPLRKLSTEVIELLGLMSKQKGIVLHNAIESDIRVCADTNMVKLVLRNLISNSIKFSYTNGVIDVSASKRDGVVAVTVSDNGTGIPKEKASKLFGEDILYSTEGTAKEKGTGLGLLLCKEIVEKLGGDIWAESEEGVGSKFNFTLPLV